MLISKYGNGTSKLVESFENKYSIELDELTEGLREMWKQEYEKYKGIIQEEVTVK